jgi:tRNA nucleotidyltransferase (CCA-adding enzyme)
LVKLKYSKKKKKRSVLDRTINFFATSSYHTYLVGGYVRDITLGIEPIDIDIVVEGNAILAARALNKQLKGKLYVHKEFGTASIVTKDKRIDLASARIEKYDSPAQLPHVYPSTINEDLNRRDFTINAMAMSISRDNFGELFDPFNGLQDVKNGLIRVLHKNSFIDDPTRIFRALRYKNRFSFKLEKKTKILMKEAIDQKIITHLTGQRILNELRLIFQEQKYGDTIKDMSNLKIYRIKKKDLDILQSLGKDGFYYYLARIKANSMPITAEEKKIIKDMNSLPHILARLEKTKKTSTVYYTLCDVSESVLTSIEQLRPGLEDKMRIFRKSKKITPHITGNDLKRRGFPENKEYKRILRAVFTLQLDKKITSRKQALQYLKSFKK